MDCNCRCCLLQIPRWAIDHEFTKIDNSNQFTKDDEVNLIKGKDYNEYKKNYFSYLNNSENDDKINNNDSLLENFNKYKDIDISELSIEQRSLVINYKMYQMDMGEEYLEEAQKYNKLLQNKINENVISNNYYNDNFIEKFNKATIYETKDSSRLEDIYRLQLNKLKDIERESLTAYSGADYESINMSLRNSRITISEKNKILIDNIENALNKSKLTEDIMLHRHVEFDGLSGLTGIKEGKLKNSSIEELKELLKGNTYTEKAFCSTSIRNFEGEFREIVYDIVAPKNTNGLYINEISNYRNVEYEFLLQKNTEFKVQDVLKDKDGTIRIVMEVVNE